MKAKVPDLEQDSALRSSGGAPQEGAGAPGRMWARNYRA